MFWDRVAGVYDLFANFYNAGTHRVLCKEVASLVSSDDEVLECACGTGMLTRHIAPACKHIIATDFSVKMLERARYKCRDYSNASFEYADILHLDYPDESFDKVVAANVIHLLDEPLKALSELDRVCRKGGLIIIPTYMNREKGDGKTSGFATAVGKAGADFKRQFTFSGYQQFFAEAGYKDASFKMIEGRVPCAVAALYKKG